MTDRGFRPRALGEIAIRCADLAKMVAFYEEVIGLTRLPGNAADHIVFFGLGESHGGHTAVLALFRDETEGPSDAHRPGAPVTGAGSSLHHLALSLPASEQAAVLAWYDQLGQPYKVELFNWIGWRGIFTQDPEGNTVELVAYDASFAASARKNAGLSGEDSAGA